MTSRGQRSMLRIGVEAPPVATMASEVVATRHGGLGVELREGLRLGVDFPGYLIRMLIETVKS